MSSWVVQRAGAEDVTVDQLVLHDLDLVFERDVKWRRDLRTAKPELHNECGCREMSHRVTDHGSD